MRFLSTGWIIISKILFKARQSNIHLCSVISNRSMVTFQGKECFIFRAKSFIKINHMYFVRILVFFYAPFFYFNGFLTTGGETSCCPSTISRVVNGKIFILWIKCQILHRSFFAINTFILEVVPKLPTLS